MNRVGVKYKIYMSVCLLFDFAFLVGLGEGSEDAALGRRRTIEGFGSLEVHIFRQMFHKELILVLN